MKNLSKIVLLIAVGFVSANIVPAQDEPAPLPPNAVRMPNGKEQPLENGVKLLKQINLANGGKMLDSVKTLRLTGKRRIDNLFYDVKVLIDTTKEKVRQETISGQYGTSIEQLEGKKLWIYRAEKIEYFENSSSELRMFLDNGILGFRINSLKNISLSLFEIDPITTLKTMRVTINGRNYEWVFDTKNRLISEVYKDETGDEKYFTQVRASFDDFSKIDGITLPRRKISTLRSYPSDIVLLDSLDWTNIEVNPVLITKDWAVPK
jgi:hypothetical protein